MRRFLAIAPMLLLLTACSKTVAFTLTYDLDNPVQREQLTDAAVRVIENRIRGQKKELIKHEVKEENGKTQLILTVPDAEVATMLEESLMTPFTMSIMTQVDAGMGDISNEKFGDFQETSITTEYFESVQPHEVEGGKGSAIITFTPEGQELLKTFFRENRGATIAIFVRGVLMSKKVIDTVDSDPVISVDGIPTVGVARVFADDVNVGLHVSFSQEP